MTDLKKNMDTRGLAPYLLRILDILRQTICAFASFWITVGQSSSTADIILPRYFKYGTI